MTAMRDLPLPTGYLKLGLHIPSIMCEASCVKSVKSALQENITGIDVIAADVSQKNITATYDLKYLREHFGAEPLRADLAQQTIGVSFKDLIAKISSTVEDIGHEKPSLLSASVHADDDNSSSTVGTANATTTSLRKKKNGPSFSEVLMQHSVMKGLQAATMVLMILMIPIMLSAIYVVLSRAVKRTNDMPGM